MDQRAFVRRRGPAWERLEQLVDRASRHGLGSFPADDLFQLGRLYRLVTSDLAYAQSRSFDETVTQYLNRLIARAHAYVYARSVEGGWRRIAQFFSATFPMEVRASWVPIGACTALTVLCACIAWVIVMRNPTDAYALLPAQIIPAHITKSLHDSNFAVSPQRSSEMAAFIITNNVRIAYYAFAGGIATLGAFTVYEIGLNGLMVGGLGALFAQAGFGRDFWVTVAPHGFIELTAIQIAGGAGLLIAAGVLMPGRRSRRDAIAANARRAGVLITGVTAMLCVAGTIEGFFSPLRFGESVRASVGIVTAILLVLYFGLPRSRRAA